MADLFLSFPGKKFIFAFGFQVGIYVCFFGYSSILPFTRCNLPPVSSIVLDFMIFLVLDFGLTDSTLALVILVIKLLSGTELPFSFFPLPRCGTSFQRALGEGSSPPGVP